MENLLWEAFQEGQILRASAQADDAKSRAYDANAQVAALSYKVERLALICQGMWSLISEHTSLTEADLLAKINQLKNDLDPAKNPSRNTKACPSCKTILATTADSCYRCGLAVKAEPSPFR